MKQGVPHRILIVNDAPDQLELMGFMLRRAGYEVITASDGKEGVEIAQSQLPELIISDIAMPRMDGVELCRKIRSDRQISAIPIILVTALLKDSRDMVKGLNAGADDYLEAPYEPIRLIAKVARLLGRKQT